MSDEEELGGDVPDGAAIFPDIPADLGINPLWLAVLHATVFLAGSDEHIVHPDAAEEAMQGLVGYLHRLEAEQLARVREDMEVLSTYARQQKWPKGFLQALKTFLADIGLEEA
ncbi:MAG: hypothetical protein U0797_02280 [Gemmataceae bacterium]